MSFALAFLGVVLFGIGFIQDIRAWDPSQGVMFWAIGVVVSIPGFYFTVKVIQAYRAPDEQTRQAILSEIPDM